MLVIIENENIKAIAFFIEFRDSSEDVLRIMRVCISFVYLHQSN